MQMTQQKIAWEGNSECAVGASFRPEVWSKEAEQGHPEQHPTAGGEGLGFHLLPSRPQLARSGRT